MKENRLWRHRLVQFSAIFDWLDNPPSDHQYQEIRSTYFYYNILCKQTMFFDGSVRLKNGEKREFK